MEHPAGQPLSRAVFLPVPSREALTDGVQAIAAISGEGAHEGAAAAAYAARYATADRAVPCCLPVVLPLSVVGYPSPTFHWESFLNAPQDRCR